MATFLGLRDTFVVSREVLHYRVVYIVRLQLIQFLVGREEKASTRQNVMHFVSSARLIDRRELYGDCLQLVKRRVLPVSLKHNEKIMFELEFNLKLRKLVFSCF